MNLYDSKHRNIAWLWVIIGLMVLILSMIFVIPSTRNAIALRADLLWTHIKRQADPIGAVPTAVPTSTQAELNAPMIRTLTQTPTASGTVELTSTPQPSPTTFYTPTPIPSMVEFPAPKLEEQDWNNCGPATLAMYLRMYGWEGDQFVISNVIKPTRGDRNVNIDELIYFVNNYAGWLKAEYRVAGTVDLLRQFLAAGIPIAIEEGFYLSPDDLGITGPSDDRWTGHYLLLTGYDDSRNLFIAQDSVRGPDQVVTYKELDKNWQAFNRVMLIVYPPDKANTVAALLNTDTDEETNRQHALETAQRETEKEPGNPYAWFNFGSNLVYFDRYVEAALAYDTARQLGLPQRMLRYQFGPFLAYFHTNRNEDLLSLTEYALKVTANSEEAHMWRGWALYRAGEREEAVNMFEKALEVRPDYSDALYGLNFVLTN